MKRREFGLMTSALALATALPFRSAAAAEDFKASSGQPIYFRGWQFATDVVQSNVKRYNDTQAGKVDYATVTGDYPAIMEQNLMAGSELDVLYANPSSAVRYYGGGWVMPAEELPNIEEIKADFLPQFLDAWSYDGKLLGLSYFASCRGCIHTNLLAYEKAGFSDKDFPKNWDELYEQVYALHDKGIETPILPHWFGEYFGISWGFVFEVLNRGNQIADPRTHKPLLTTEASGAAYKTLAAWKKLWNSKLVPEEVMTYSEAAYIDAYASGRYVFSPQQIYDLQVFNKVGRSQIAGHSTILPVGDHPWGIIDSALYLMTKRDRPDAVTQDVKKFTSWYGYKDDTGKVAIAERWVQENMLFSAYKSVMDDEKTAERVRKAVARPDDYKTVLDVYKATPFPAGIWKVVWSEEFNAYLKDTLANFLTQDGDIVATITAMNDKITELNEKYGI
ncbi:multiple sugar transport system substrate-binding protein [Arboricoccus pini]|uniref:Multiple sugar transport system substrate-binding protein n=1 Tax=Arboricoccus pini TaxID=1963835 RepID=A0A212RYR5_9PROT|nr:extracellular solute-binding protein [Arboricoccus pini]SNB77954.1 multiple sugar transport system substrate-binding protein [Arboricoccus pini]